LATYTTVQMIRGNIKTTAKHDKPKQTEIIQLATAAWHTAILVTEQLAASFPVCVIPIPREANLVASSLLGKSDNRSACKGIRLNDNDDFRTFIFSMGC